MPRLIHSLCVLSCLVGLATLGLSTLGCGSAPPPAPAGSGEAKPGATTTTQAKPQLRIVDAATLPIGDYMPPLDQGRVELAVPKEWSVPSRDRKYVVRLVRSSNPYPQIRVTSTPDDWSNLSELSKDNVAQFAEAVASRIENAEKKIELIEPVIPMMLGDRPVARYVRRTRFKGNNKSVTVERQILVTLGAKQVYEIDLQVPVGRIKAYRDAGYAVAASMKFPTAEGQENPPAETNASGDMPPKTETP